MACHHGMTIRVTIARVFLAAILGTPPPAGAVISVLTTPGECPDVGDSTDEFADALTPAGDLDGDGYLDFAVGAGLYDGRSDGQKKVNQGAVYVCFGPLTPSGIAARILVLPSQPDFAAWNFGRALRHVQGFDGPTSAALLVGAPGFDRSGAPDCGQAYFVRFDANRTATVSPIDASSIAWYGGEKVGSSVASAGDFNGDGYTDAVVGSNASFATRGRVRVYFGGPSFDGTPDIVIRGETTGDKFGGAITSLGDLNGDSRADLLVSAPLQDPSASLVDAGRLYIFYGRASGDTALVAAGADVVLDGQYPGQSMGRSVADLGDFAGAGTSAFAAGCGDERLVIYRGPVTSGAAPDLEIGSAGGSDLGWFGESSEGVRSGGDFDGDDNDDLVVGASGEERAYILVRGSELFCQPPGTTCVTDLASIPPANLIIVSSPGLDGDLFGASVSFAGDISGDGRDEILVGSPRHGPRCWEPNPSDPVIYPGAAFVYSAASSLSGSMWLSFDLQSHVTQLRIAPLQPFSWHIVGDPGFALRSWQASLAIDPGIVVTSRTPWPPGSHDQGSGDDNWIVAAAGNACTQAEEWPSSFCEYQAILLQSATDLRVTLNPASPPQVVEPRPIDGGVHPGWTDCSSAPPYAQGRPTAFGGWDEYANRYLWVNLTSTGNPSLQAHERSWLASVGQNPSSSAFVLEYSLGSTVSNQLRVLDLRGRVVRKLAVSGRSSDGAMRGRLVWDGRDDAGARVASGTYFLATPDDPQVVAPLKLVLIN